MVPGNKKNEKDRDQSQSIWNPREPMPSFFHPLCKAGWCPAERFCRPLALKTGAWHIALWTRAPFYEMWGKPKDCREPQESDIII